MVFVDVGAGVFVRADEIVAVHDDLPAFPSDMGLALPAWGDPQPRAVVLLRTGQKIPAYLRAQTILRRVEQALRLGGGRA